MNMKLCPLCTFHIVFLQAFLSKYVALSVEALDTNNKHPSRSKSFTFGTKGTTSTPSNNSNIKKTSFSLLSPLKSKLNDLNDKVDSDIFRISQSVKDSPRILLGPVKNKIDDLNIKVDTDILKFSESVKRVKGWKENFKSGSDIQTVILSKLLSRESQNAVKTIRRILNEFPDHGVVDVFSIYPTKDVVASILALSRLQRSSAHAQLRLRETEVTSKSDYVTDLLNEDYQAQDKQNSLSNEVELLSDLAHYAVFANAAYGWKMGLLSGRLHLGDLETLLRKTGIDDRHVVFTNWKSKTHLPAYFIVRDVERKKIVLSIRGTLSARDVLTDLCCTSEEFLPHSGDVINTSTPLNIKTKFKARAHHGMLEAARGVSGATKEIITSELIENPGYDLVIVGHSLGGGTAAVLGSLWRNLFPSLTVFAYGCPCVGPLEVHPTVNDSIISVVGVEDPFSCLSLGHLAEITSTLSKLCENHDLRNTVLAKTQSDVEGMDDTDLFWCLDLLSSFRGEIVAEKFYPPGRIFYMSGNQFDGDDEITLKEVNQEHFMDLKLHPRMFDLSRHVPHRYEAVLRRLWTNYEGKD